MHLPTPLQVPLEDTLEDHLSGHPRRGDVQPLGFAAHFVVARASDGREVVVRGNEGEHMYEASIQ